MRFSKCESASQGASGAASSRHRRIIGIVILSCAFSVCFLYLDNAAMVWVKYLHQVRPPLYAFFEVVDPLMNFLGHGATLIIGSLVLYGVARYRKGNLETLGRTLFIGLVSAGLVVQGLKHLTGRARPRLTDELLFIGPSLRGGYDSFPSGHTTMAFCLAAILSRCFPSHCVVFYVFAVGVGFARVGAASHFPSDVLAGAVVGILVGKAFAGRLKSFVRSAPCQR